jgi:hypothetical protein
MYRPGITFGERRITEAKFEKSIGNYNFCFISYIENEYFTKERKTCVQRKQLLGGIFLI